MIDFSYKRNNRLFTNEVLQEKHLSPVGSNLHRYRLFGRSGRIEIGSLPEITTAIETSSGITVSPAEEFGKFVVDDSEVCPITDYRTDLTVVSESSLIYKLNRNIGQYSRKVDKKKY